MIVIRTNVFYANAHAYVHCGHYSEEQVEAELTGVAEEQQLDQAAHDDSDVESEPAGQRVNTGIVAIMILNVFSQDISISTMAGFSESAVGK